MIAAAALVPQAPLLLPGLTGRNDPVADLRRAVQEVVGDLVAADPDEVVLIGSGPTTTTLAVRTDLGLHRWGAGQGCGDDQGCGVDQDRGVDQGSGAGRASGERPAVGRIDEQAPLPFAVGSVLLDAAGYRGDRRWQQVGWDDAGAHAAAVGTTLAAGLRRVALLVLGDSSARRTVKAPGALDDRAAPFDADLMAALTSDPMRLVDVDAALAAELLVSGLPAWQALAGALHVAADGAGRLQVRWSGDPFGVLYVVGSAAGPRDD